VLRPAGRVGDNELEFDKVFLNTGTRDSVDGIEGLDSVPCPTSRTILDRRDLPEHLNCRRRWLRRL